MPLMTLITKKEFFEKINSKIRVFYYNFMHDEINWSCHINI